MKKIVVLTGAGISAESGIRTFRDMGGLWEEYDVMEVASIDGWYKNKELVLNFYNERRLQLANSKPNKGHQILVELEKDFDVKIITQNVDNLHEQAGSTNILHLHGELTKVRSTGNNKDIRDIGYTKINLGDHCKNGFQLRPHIVWFGEAVPAIKKAIKITKTAEIYIIIGTSLNVYPAASLIHYVPQNCPIFLVDPNKIEFLGKNITIIQEPASTGMEKIRDLIMSN